MRTFTTITVFILMGWSGVALCCDASDPLRFSPGEDFPECLEVQSRSFNDDYEKQYQELRIENKCDSAATFEAEDCPECDGPLTIDLGEVAYFGVGDRDQKGGSATLRWTVIPSEGDSEETGIASLSYYLPNSCGGCTTALESRPGSGSWLFFLLGAALVTIRTRGIGYSKG